jgi:hypothetical protein
MKIKSLSFNKYKLFKFTLFKSQVNDDKINKFIQQNFFNSSFENLELHFKKAFKIIFKYHINSRKIFFVGLPQFKGINFNNSLKLNHTNHLFIPNSSWINGFILNKKFILRNLKYKFLKTKLFNDKKKLNFFLSLKGKPDLVVVFNPNKELNFLKEFARFGIPIITFGNTISNFKNFYTVPGIYKFSFKKNQNVFTLLLYAIFKRYLKSLNYFSFKYFRKKSIHKFKRKIYYFKYKSFKKNKFKYFKKLKKFGRKNNIINDLYKK